MATEEILEALRASQLDQGLSLRGLAKELGFTHAFLSLLFKGRRPLTRDSQKVIERFLRPLPSVSLGNTLEQFIGSSVHRSPKTTTTLRERLVPFLDHLARLGIGDPMHISREHVDGFISEIAMGRRGRRLSPASVFGFTKDVQAFINYVADTLAPEDWRNPVRKLHIKHPQVVIHPLSRSQVDTLLAVAASLAPTPLLKARNLAMLLTLLDGALRISELMNALSVHLEDDGILQVFGKGAKEREVVLAASTMTAIQDYHALRDDKSPFLFVTEDGAQLTYHGVKSLFQRWRNAAQTEFQGVRMSAHTLRHTSATMRRMAGMSEGDLQTFLGHATPAMTRHYSAFALSASANNAARQTSPVEAMFNPDKRTGPSSPSVMNSSQSGISLRLRS